MFFKNKKVPKTIEKEILFRFFHFKGNQDRQGLMIICDSVVESDGCLEIKGNYKKTTDGIFRYIPNYVCQIKNTNDILMIEKNNITISVLDE
jgi:hypothetical protein